MIWCDDDDDINQKIFHSICLLPKHLLPSLQQPPLILLHSLYLSCVIKWGNFLFFCGQEWKQQKEIPLAKVWKWKIRIQPWKMSFLLWFSFFLENYVWCLECKDVWSTDTHAVTVVLVFIIIIIITFLYNIILYVVCVHSLLKALNISLNIDRFYW